MKRHIRKKAHQAHCRTQTSLRPSDMQGHPRHSQRQTCQQPPSLLFSFSSPFAFGSKSQRLKQNERRGPEKPWAAVEPPDNKFGGRITLSSPIRGHPCSRERERERDVAQLTPWDGDLLRSSFWSYFG
ncbi:hypothetical protein CDAR_269661 [Caerostris darwini]|uniref:Uncharacterized protein n=1 Tax=Caerostris darwini TaxID=1538125 RepID=A0AAV4SJY8_9ARAC|nr:hypothetical protein CDAR_269661 [Caerostris darwini]